MKKIKGYLRYPLRLDISSYLPSDTSLINNHGNIYELTGLVVHWGTLEHGHYIAVIKKQIEG